MNGNGSRYVVVLCAMVPEASQPPKALTPEADGVARAKNIRIVLG